MRLTRPVACESCMRHVVGLHAASLPSSNGVQCAAAFGTFESPSLHSRPSPPHQPRVPGVPRVPSRATPCLAEPSPCPRRNSSASRALACLASQLEPRKRRRIARHTCTSHVARHTRMSHVAPFTRPVARRMLHAARREVACCKLTVEQAYRLNQGGCILASPTSNSPRSAGRSP